MDEPLGGSSCCAHGKAEEGAVCLCVCRGRQVRRLSSPRSGGLPQAPRGENGQPGAPPDIRAVGKTLAEGTKIQFCPGSSASASLAGPLSR